MFIINSETLLFIVDYHSKFPIIKKVNSLSANDQDEFFAEYGPSKKVVSDAGTNFMAETYKAFCRRMYIQQTIASSYHHQSNGQEEVCIKFLKCSIKMF